MRTFPLTAASPLLAGLLSVALLAGLIAPPLAHAAEAELSFANFDDSRAEYQRSVAPVLAKYCSQCHGEELAEKDLNLLALPPDMKGSTSAARWAVVLTNISLGKMPPKDEPQPSAEQIAAINGWIQAEMKRSGKHLAMRAEYHDGNVVEHGLLFHAKQTGPLDVPAGVRRLSPEIYEAFAKEAGKGSTVAQPFTPPGGTTFRDMGAPKIDEPTVQQLLSNALVMVGNLTAHKMEGGVAKSERSAPAVLVRLFDEKNPAGDAEIEAAIAYMFDFVLRRKPTAEEVASLTALVKQNIKDSGRENGVRYALAAVYLLPEAVLRYERGDRSPAENGLVRLTPREIAFAISYALTDRRPDSSLLADAEAGKLDTQEGVRAAVRKLLDDEKLAKPRIMRFFREYFGFEGATEVFKDANDRVEHFPREYVADLTRLIEHILENDKQVLRELLTTNKMFVNYRWDAGKKLAVRQTGAAAHLAYGLPPDWKWTADQPIELPQNQRAGVLTHPAFLVAVSKSDDNDVIHRGKWIRERLLGNVVPDIPITVDAQLPIAPEKTLRERMTVTEEQYCWQCHRLMNKVGYPFEMYDHYGRFRTAERVLDREGTEKNVDPKGKPLGPIQKSVPADSRGAVEHVGDPSLEGEVKDAVELMHRLAGSERVEQVFVRHVFRFFLGRNESPGDAASLRAAHAAYRTSDGSMKALIAELLASESFLYRVAEQTTSVEATNGSLDDN